MIDDRYISDTRVNPDLCVYDVFEGDHADEPDDVKPLRYDVRVDYGNDDDEYKVESCEASEKLRVQLFGQQEAEMSLGDRCADYVASAVEEIAKNPEAFGVSEPFGSVQEFVDFEFEGDADDEADLIADEYGIDPDEAREALTAAYRAYSLSEINAGFKNEDDGDEGDEDEGEDDED